MDFDPPHIWRGGHRQTLAGALLRRAPRLPAKRLTFASAYGDRLSLDVLAARGGDPQGRLLLLHGLTGNSQASPIPQIARRCSELEIETWCLNFRGADGLCPTIPKLYHAGCSEDLEAVFTQLPQDRPWVVAGFSLGANVLLKWLGEGPEIKPTAALAASCPFDLRTCAIQLESNIMNRCYRAVLMRNLKRLARTFLRGYPELSPSHPLERWTTFYDIDQHLTAPLHGFRDAYDYWEKCSSSRFLSRIATPSLVLHARDDPFQPYPPVEQQNPYINWATPETGGHLGFMNGLSGDWLVEKVARYSEAVFKA